MKKVSETVRQRQRNGVDSTSGTTCRQHLLSSVTHILIGVRITGGTVDTMVREAGTRFLEFPF